MANSTKFRKLKIGQWYRVRFLDHSIDNGGDVVVCRVYGWLVKNERKHISISTWGCEDEEYKDANKELVNVVKMAIIEIVAV